jgi:hypothetical protein
MADTAPQPGHAATASGTSPLPLKVSTSRVPAPGPAGSRPGWSGWPGPGHGGRSRCRCRGGWRRPGVVVGPVAVGQGQDGRGDQAHGDVHDTAPSPEGPAHRVRLRKRGRPARGRVRPVRGERGCRPQRVRSADSCQGRNDGGGPYTPTLRHHHLHGGVGDPPAATRMTRHTRNTANPATRISLALARWAPAVRWPRSCRPRHRRRPGGGRHRQARVYQGGAEGRAITVHATRGRGNFYC